MPFTVASTPAAYDKNSHHRSHDENPGKTRFFVPRTETRTRPGPVESGWTRAETLSGDGDEEAGGGGDLGSGGVGGFGFDLEAAAAAVDEAGAGLDLFADGGRPPVTHPELGGVRGGLVGGQHEAPEGVEDGGDDSAAGSGR